jgi:hypothetical protein
MGGVVASESCRLPRERKPAQIVAVHGEHIEGAELDFLTVLAGMQRVEIGDAIDAQERPPRRRSQTA